MIYSEAMKYCSGFDFCGRRATCGDLKFWMEVIDSNFLFRINSQLRLLGGKKIDPNGWYWAYVLGAEGDRKMAFRILDYPHLECCGRRGDGIFRIPPQYSDEHFKFGENLEKFLGRVRPVIDLSDFL